MKKTHQQKMGRDGKYKSLAKVTTEAEPLECGFGSCWVQACILVGTDEPLSNVPTHELAKVLEHHGSMEPIETGIFSADGREWFIGHVLERVYPRGATRAESTLVRHYLEIPGGLSPAFASSGGSHLDGVQAWAENVLRESDIPIEWQRALGATGGREATPEWFAAEALASVVSARAFIAEGKARDAVSSAMWASKYYHQAMMHELSARVHIGNRVKQAPHIGKYTASDYSAWGKQLEKLVKLETYRKSVTKTAKEIARVTGGGVSAIKAYLLENHRNRFAVKPRRK